jgi:prevent-host-death family protein
VRTFNIHEAKTHLSRLVDQAAAGAPFIIAKAGRPMVQVVPIDVGVAETGRVGFLSGASIPDDFDQMGATDIADTFEGKS